MPIQTNDLQGLIIASLSNADPDARPELVRVVPLYWPLFNRFGYLPELQYWYVRREAIKALIGFLAREVEYLRRSQTGDRSEAASARQDGKSSALGTEDSSSTADRKSASKFDDENDSNGAGSSAANRQSNQSSSAHQLANSSANATSNSSSTMHTQSTTQERGQTTETNQQAWSLSHARTGSGYRKLNMTQQFNEIIGNFDIGIHPQLQLYFPGFTIHVPGFNVGPWRIGGIDFGVPAIGPFNWDLTALFEFGTKAETVTASVSDSANQSEDHVHGTGGPYRTTSYQLTIGVLPTRAADGATNEAAQSNSQSNSQMTSSETMDAQSAQAANSNAQSTMEANGHGEGITGAEGKSSSALNAVSQRNLHADGEEHRAVTATMDMTMVMERLHQRVLHLQDLWKSANAMIEWLESQRLSLPATVLQAMTLQYPAGLDADSANALLVQTPFGRGGRAPG